jgi:hypothetical protein
VLALACRSFVKPLLVFAVFLKVEGVLLESTGGGPARPTILFVGLGLELTWIAMLLAPKTRVLALWGLIFGCLAAAIMHLAAPDLDCGCLGRLSEHAFGEIMFLLILGGIATIEIASMGRRGGPL